MYVNSFSSIPYCSNVRLISNIELEYMLLDCDMTQWFSQVVRDIAPQPIQLTTQIRTHPSRAASSVGIMYHFSGPNTGSNSGGGQNLTIQFELFSYNSFTECLDLGWVCFSLVCRFLFQFILYTFIVQNQWYNKIGLQFC